MTKQDIRIAYTKTISDLLAKGYFIYPDTMSGTQGEIAKIDLSDGEKVIRVYLDHDYSTETFADRILLVVGRVPQATLNHGGTVWTHKLEIISRRVFESADYNRGREYIEIKN